MAWHGGSRTQLQRRMLVVAAKGCHNSAHRTPLLAAAKGSPVLAPTHLTLPPLRFRLSCLCPPPNPLPPASHTHPSTFLRCPWCSTRLCTAAAAASPGTGLAPCWACGTTTATAPAVPAAAAARAAAGAGDTCWRRATAVGCRGGGEQSPVLALLLHSHSLEQILSYASSCNASIFGSMCGCQKLSQQGQPQAAAGTNHRHTYLRSFGPHALRKQHRS